MSSTHTTLMASSKDEFNQLPPAEKIPFLMAALHPKRSLPRFYDTILEIEPMVEFAPALLTRHPKPKGFYHFSMSSPEIEEDRKDPIIDLLQDIRVKAERQERHEQREHMKESFRMLETEAMRILQTGYDIDPQNCGAKPMDLERAYKEISKATAKAIHRGFLPPLADGIAQPVAGTRDPSTLSPIELAQYMSQVVEYDVAQLVRPSLTKDRRFFSFMGIFRCCNQLVLRSVMAEENERANCAAYEEIQQAQYYMYNVQPIYDQQVFCDQSQQGLAFSDSVPELEPSSTPSPEQHSIQEHVDQPISAPITHPVSPPIKSSTPVIVDGSSEPVIVNDSSEPCSPVLEPDKVDALPPEEENKPELKAEPESEPETEPELEFTVSSTPSPSPSSDESGHNTGSGSEDHHPETDSTTPTSSVGSLPLPIPKIIIFLAPLAEFDDGCPRPDSWADEEEDDDEIQATPQPSIVEPAPGQYLEAPPLDAYGRMVERESSTEEDEEEDEEEDSKPQPATVQPAQKHNFAPLPQFDEGGPVYENWADEVDDCESE